LISAGQRLCVYGIVKLCLLFEGQVIDVTIFTINITILSIRY